MAGLRCSMERTGLSFSGGGRGLRLALMGALLLPLMACNNFFQCENKPACPASTGTGTGTGTGTSGALDVAFVSYTTSAGASVVTGYQLAGGALSAINTITLPAVPVAMAVSPKNNFLYVATVPSAASPGIYTYAIGTDGTLATNGTLVATDTVGAMTISPDGNYLYTLQASTQSMTQYQVNTSTGALGNAGQITVLSTSCAPIVAAPVLPECGLAVSPKEDYVWAALGAQGDAVFSYTSTAVTGGVPNQYFQTLTAGANSGDFSVAFDANDNAYLAQTNTFSWYSVTSGQFTQKAYYTYPSGSIPRSVVVDPDSKFVYTADVGTGKISGFTAASVTQLAGSPYAAPTSVSALGIDNTDTYLVAVGYDGTAGIQLYSIASSGVLSALAKTAGTSTVTTDPVLVAMTH
jgi:6-phosphogluconolactonase